MHYNVLKKNNCINIRNTGVELIEVVLLHNCKIINISLIKCNSNKIALIMSACIINKYYQFYFNAYHDTERKRYKIKL